VEAYYPILAAIAGGVLPALAWLWFWRREDSRHPEPRRLIALAFFAGMLAVAVVIPIEKFVQPYAGDVSWLPPMTILFIAWAFIEEITKYLAAYITVLRRAEDDEPIDPVIYMVTTALGFAAAENTLFLLSPLAGSTVVQTLITGNLRFVGATLLHVLSSAVIGLALALSFYAKRNIKRRYAFFGVIVASILHSVFNFFIINTTEEHLLRTFAFVWLGIVALLAVLEFVKRIKPRWT
jgi:RsiW-degrading membrane proteinase PrsW (M82 family)